MNQGEEIPWSKETHNDGKIEDVYEIEDDQEAVPAWVVAEAGCPEAVLFDEEYHLVGGMFSGHGPYSFRGKVYNSFISETTGQSLYTDRMENEDVNAVAKKLEQLDPTDPTVENTFQSEEEFESFRKMWSKFADSDAWLLGWW